LFQWYVLIDVTQNARPLVPKIAGAPPFCTPVEFQFLNRVNGLPVQR
jgi:hypothetical protein